MCDQINIFHKKTKISAQIYITLVLGALIGWNFLIIQ